jgi:hypothetical protein
MILFLSTLFVISIISKFHKNNNKIYLKITSGCDERYEYLNQTNMEDKIDMIEFKYNFSKNLLHLHLLNTLINPTISIYYKVLIIDNFNIFANFSHNMVTNKDTIIGANILAGGLFNDWDFEM